MTVLTYIIMYFRHFLNNWKVGRYSFHQDFLFFSSDILFFQFRSCHSACTNMFHHKMNRCIMKIAFRLRRSLKISSASWEKTVVRFWHIASCTSWNDDYISFSKSSSSFKIRFSFSFSSSELMFTIEAMSNE